MQNFKLYGKISHSLDVFIFSASDNNMKKIIIVLILLTVSACVAKNADPKASLDLSNDPVKLRMILAQMPKGAELHTHLSGIPYAENFIEWAATDNACINQDTGKILPGPCKDDSKPAQEAYKDTGLWTSTVNLLSARQQKRDDRTWGHDHFFDTFGKFGAAKNDKGRMLALAASQAVMDNVQYLETMVSIYGPKWVSPWAKKAGWNGDPDATMQKLLQAGLLDDLDSIPAKLDEWENKKKEILGIGPGNDVAIRYINQIFRGTDPEYVFAQMVWSFELVRRDPRVVGLNMVGPEDSPIAVRDYELHMDMLDFLHSRYPEVPITLHAGELTPTLTTPKALSNHISLAVTKGHARRIGHGVDIAFEQNAHKTLDFMRNNNIALEVLLSSNDTILHVSGNEHPLRTYMDFGVPVVLSTDDMGIARSTLTNEFVLAVEDQGLGYGDLKRAVRNSLEYSFLPGNSLWTDDSYEKMHPACQGDATPDVECKALLSSNQKAEQQWRLEKRLREFEKVEDRK